MGKRSDGAFERRPLDDYPTPQPAVLPLMPFLKADGIETYAEPCAGEGKLIEHLSAFGLQCVWQNDIRTGMNALDLKAAEFKRLGADAIISNPPWGRTTLHAMMDHFMRLVPTWLLIDADWPHTVQARDLLSYCSHMVSVGRLKWIPGSPNTGKDNVIWVRIHRGHRGGPKFYGRQVL